MTVDATAPLREVPASAERDAPDDALVKQTLRGDAEAFSELVRRHQRVVYNLAYRYMREPSLAEDMAQEAFLKAFRLLKGFRGDCAFSTWLYRVTCSVCVTELTRRKRRGEIEFPQNFAGKATSLRVEGLDLPELMASCIAKLPEKYSRIISLYYLNEISYDEITEIMRVPMGTLKTWMHRARRQLRKIVEREMSLDG